MGRHGRDALEGLSAQERFDHGLRLADRMVEAYLGKLPEALDVREGESIDPETRRRRFEALRELAEV